MKLSIYKPGQGKYARITSGVLLGALVAYGATALRTTLGDVGTTWKIGSQTFSVGQVVPLLVFVVLAAVIAWSLNWPKVADFLIETESEMARVIWPTRKTVISSSVVVIIAVVAMSALLYGVDSLLFVILKGAGLY